MSGHALLSPSGASRWMACPPSARLEERFPESASSYAEEGTLAHALAEAVSSYNFRKYINAGITKAKLNKKLTEIQTSPYYDADMERHIDAFCKYVHEEYLASRATCKDAVIALEERLDLTEYIPDGFGTGDVVIIADSLLTVIDLKYGQGVQVEAENNTQMMLYALGALSQYGHLYAIETVRMVIYQPRRDNISAWSLPASELLYWAETELKEKASLAYDGAGKYCPGDHCRFCKARAVCRARAEENIKLARYDFAPADSLSVEEIADILKIGEKLINWFGDISGHALNEALAGTEYPGWKVVEGRSNRKIAEEQAVLTALTTEGYTQEEVCSVKLKGIGDLEKLLGKEIFNENIGRYVVKPQGKPVLVPESDSRPALNSAAAAAADFENIA